MFNLHFISCQLAKPIKDWYLIRVLILYLTEVSMSCRRKAGPMMMKQLRKCWTTCLWSRNLNSSLFIFRTFFYVSCTCCSSLSFEEFVVLYVKYFMMINTSGILLLDIAGSPFQFCPQYGYYMLVPSLTVRYVPPISGFD